MSRTLYRLSPLFRRCLPLTSFTFLLVCIPLFVGCSAPGGARDSPSSMVALSKVESAAAPAAAEAEGNIPPAAAMPRKIIYTATVEMATEDMTGASQKITEQVKRVGGFIAESQVSGAVTGQAGGGESNRARETHWKIRVPADRFEAFLTALGGIGETQSSHVSSEDVSEEFYDVAARLRNKRVEEARLIDHLKASTGKLSEILLVEKEISRVREEIERMEGRLRFLANQTDLSTVEITLHEIKGYVPDSSPSLWTQARRTLGASLSGLAEFGRALLLLVIALLPWAILGAGIGAPFYLRHRRRQIAAMRARPAQKDVAE